MFSSNGELRVLIKCQQPAKKSATLDLEPSTFRLLAF